MKSRSGEGSIDLAAQADGDSLKVEQAGPSSSRNSKLPLDLMQPTQLLQNSCYMATVHEDKSQQQNSIALCLYDMHISGHASSDVSQYHMHRLHRHKCRSV